jgi:hypothetical protein
MKGPFRTKNVLKGPFMTLKTQPRQFFPSHSVFPGPAREDFTTARPLSGKRARQQTQASSRTSERPHNAVKASLRDSESLKLAFTDQKNQCAAGPSTASFANRSFSRSYERPISVSASTRPAQDEPSTLLPGSRSL